MIASLCLVSCLWVGQPLDRTEWQLTPQLTPGLELVYQGTYLDEALSPHVQHQQQYRLEAHLLVLETKGKEWEVAFLTTLSLRDPRQPSDKKQDESASVRLELANVDAQGRARTHDKKMLEIPLLSPPTLESGFLLPVPFAKVSRQSAWDVPEAGRPDHRWQIAGTESCGGITCLKIVGLQQSEDWNNARADRTAWRRRDTLWILPQLNVAQKVERIIEHRAPARDYPTQRSTVRYELERRPKWPGNLFEGRRQEILKAKKYYEEVEAMALRPALYRPQIETLLQRLDKQLDEPGALHYRKMFVHIKSLLADAKKGEGRVPHQAEEPPAPTIQTLTVGQRTPNFAVSCLTEQEPVRIQNYRGKPVLVVFYNPATRTGKEVLSFVKQLSEKQGANVAIMAMAVTNDAETACKQHREMRLAFPILDGNGMRLTFGVAQTPRLVLLDNDGFVRLAQTGWGYQTPQEIQEELLRCRKKNP